VSLARRYVNASFSVTLDPSLAWAVCSIPQIRALSKFARTRTGAVDACSSAVKTLIQEARQARECDAALAVYRVAAPTSAALGQSAFAIKMSCSEPVKTLVARADADAANLADAKAQLANAAQSTADAVKRAESRALNTANRKAADDAVISAQPRTADGNVTCDADCLRHLSGAP